MLLKWLLLCTVANYFSVVRPVCSQSGNLALLVPPEFPPAVPVCGNDKNGADACSSSMYGQGHLMPFGSQRAPVGPVLEYNEELHPRDFYQKHIKPRRPLVYRKMVVDTPARRLWSDEYLRNTYGSLDVLCEVKHEDRSKSPRRMRMTDFLDRYQKDNVYIVTVLPDVMRKQIKAPKSVLCGSTRRFIQEANLWMSNGGTRSLIHYDSDHNIHCLLAGRKDFMMIPKKFQSQLYMASETVNGSGYSHVDPDSVDLRRYPLVEGTPWTWATIHPGDCIFIPGGYLHQVRSYGRSISETLLFTPARYFNDSDCDSADLSEKTLADIELKWTYLEGQEQIEMGYMNPELIRESMYGYIESSNDGRLSKDAFIQLFYDGLRGEKYDYKESVFSDRVWNTIKSPDRDYLTRSDVDKAPLESLKDIARVIDPPHTA